MSDSVRPMSDILSSVNDNLEKSFALDCYSATSQSEGYHYTVYHFQTDDYIQKSPKSVRHWPIKITSNPKKTNYR